MNYHTQLGTPFRPRAAATRSRCSTRKHSETTSLQRNHSKTATMSVLGCLLRPLAYVSLPVFLAHTASRNSKLARYYIRLVVYLSTLSIVSAWGVVVSIAMNVVGRRLDVNWVIARCFYALASRALDIRFEVEGEEHLSVTPAVLIGNHQSMLDILYLGR